MSIYPEMSVGLIWKMMFIISQLMPETITSNDFVSYNDASSSVPVVPNAEVITIKLLFIFT